MKTITRSLVSVAALAMAALVTQAQAADATPHADKREARQQARIAKGAESGALTPKETQRLETRQAAVNQAEANAKADGSVNAKERAQLNRMQDRNGRAIRHQKHDGQTTAPASAPTK